MNSCSSKCTCFICSALFFEPEESHGAQIELEEDNRPLWTTHKCTPTKYVGFTDEFYYCSGCNKQLDYKEEKNENEDEIGFDW